MNLEKLANDIKKVQNGIRVVGGVILIYAAVKK